MCVLGAIELPLRCATAWDPENRALEWQPPRRSSLERNASPVGTIATLLPYGPTDHAAAAQEAWMTRTRCYDLALGSLAAFNDGQGTVSEEDFRTALLLREDAWGVAFSSPDSAFHARLYDWCMERGLTDILLNVGSAHCPFLLIVDSAPYVHQSQTPFIEEHLSRTPFSRERLELLWQYHVKNGQYLRAARVLFELSKTPKYVSLSNSRSNQGRAHTT